MAKKYWRTQDELLKLVPTLAVHFFFDALKQLYQNYQKKEVFVVREKFFTLGNLFDSFPSKCNKKQQDSTQLHH